MSHKVISVHQKAQAIHPHVKIGLAIFFTLSISYAYFLQSPYNPNVVSRMSLALSLLDEGTVNINRFHKFTEDKAYINGNYYSDKAPGLSVAALPSLAVARPVLQWVCRLLGMDDDLFHKDGPTQGELTKVYSILTWISTFFTSGILTAFAALILYFTALQATGNIAGAMFATLAFGLATPAWGWATAFFGHAMSGACLFITFATICYLDQCQPKRWKDIALGFFAGGMLSWAVVVEFPAALASAIIGSFGLLSVLHWQKGRKIQILLSAVLGGFVFSLPLFIYNFMTFNSPFITGYHNVQGFPGMQQGFLGITYPHLDILYNISFSSYRGIFWITPILFLSPFALYYFWKSYKFCEASIAILLVVTYYLLFNSSYYYWHGGHSTGPRHITPILSFVCLPLCALWVKARSGLKIFLVGVLILSMSVSLVCTAVGMTSPDQFGNPLFEYLIPGFFKGETLTVFNYLRITGPMTLGPLLLVWIVSSFYICRTLRYMRRTGLSANKPG
jgi:hypothetical protein